MHAIAINTQYVPIFRSSQIDKYPGSDGYFSIESTEEELSITVDNNLLIIAPKGKNDLEFFEEGVVTVVGDVIELPPDEEIIKKRESKNLPPLPKRFAHEYAFDKTKELKSNNLLTELEYSLKSVYLYNNSKVHFQSQYRNLPKEDYETIVNGWIYAIRTFFGKLANALPRQNKLEFLLVSMDKFSTVDFKDVPLAEGLNFLYEYIENRILSKGRLLVETNKLIKEKLGGILPADEIGFIHPKNDKGNLLTEQAEIFEKLFNLEKKQNLKSLVRATIKSHRELEQRFEKIFRLNTWPIDLRP